MPLDQEPDELTMTRDGGQEFAALVAQAKANAEAEGLPVAIPKCAVWRAENGSELCPSVYCDRCQTLRERTGLEQLRPFTVPAADLLHPSHDNERSQRNG